MPPTRNTLYEKFIADLHDPVDIFAYIIYKQNKADFCRSCGADGPSAEELRQFHAIASLDTSIAAYRTQGAAMAQNFLNEGLDRLVSSTEKATRDDVVVRCIDAVSQDLGSRIDSIDRFMHARRTFSGWIRDVGGNLLVNLVTIAVIGALVIGYQYSGRFQQGAAPAAAVTAR